ncbi:glycoside hydrolase family 10 protein [Actinoalloteichus spitiensis]|uniref:glycoside hydrolase family 10 protein n=1 Tax=Actinoalloteichus spitiensis TaxID=252394 RepID=UPI00037B3C39|nr:family 10 glycosylhydrolase [Actinoalloteichus spitiensis]
MFTRQERSRRRPRVLGAGALGLLLAWSSVVPTTPSAEAEPPPAATANEEEQLRGVWISSVSNIDWPSRTGLTPEAQRAEYDALLDRAVELRLNAVFVQVRPTADAFWPSEYEPWSQWLTGTQGGDPGYDPMAYLVEQAHRRGLEFHAWFNPYRVSTQADPNRLSPDHPARRNPDWVFSYGGQLYYDPGVPAVREFVQDAMMDAVERYDVDGVHFDDYFYPYPVAGQQIPDGDTFAEHGGDFSSVADWRRDNVNRLVREMGERVRAAKPEVDFGVSPFGIWRNAATDDRGSRTSGLESYDAVYADSRRWVTEGWIDYVAPQVYWEIGHAAADYGVLVPWWSEVVAGTGVGLYTGQAAYKVGSSPAWDDAELSEHLTLNRRHPEVGGDIYFSMSSLRGNAARAIERVVRDHYSDAAAEEAPSS